MDLVNQQELPQQRLIVCFRNDSYPRLATSHGVVALTQDAVCSRDHPTATETNHRIVAFMLSDLPAVTSLDHASTRYLQLAW